MDQADVVSVRLVIPANAGTQKHQHYRMLYSIGIMKVFINLRDDEKSLLISLLDPGVRRDDDGSF